MRRAVAFIDGFNLYHALVDLEEPRLKWLNLRRVCEAYLPAPDFAVDEILYFTALAYWKPKAAARHELYQRALALQGVQTILGEFKPRDRYCRKCGNRWKHHEEKFTDVAIATHLMDRAYRGEFDVALVVTADSDIAPAIAKARSRFPKKQFRLLVPPGRMHYVSELRQACGRKHVEISRTVLERSLLRAQYNDSQGPIHRPPEYR